MLGGFLVGVLSVLGLFLFSIFLFFESNLCLSWFFLELASISFIPLFFCVGSSVNLVSLFYYLIISGVSSGLLLSGILFEECVFFLVLGLLVKFGVFPFFGWVYSVIGGVNWLAVWGFTTLLKIPFILICFFLVVGLSWSNFIIFLCSVSCFFLSVLFWVFSANWSFCWCHMMLSSSSVLVSLSFSGCSFDSLFYIFLLYFVWASLVIYFFYWCTSFESGSDNYFYFLFYYCFLLLTFPISFPIFYKVLVCVSVFSCGLFFLTCWLLYSISEQLYFVFSACGFFNQKGCPSVFGLV
uniref:NADH dehydrogenase subunit 2 n=1 Tax=Dollfustrema vaneyi TaxID=438518 RepID=A0AAU7N3N5_9TREM